MPDSPDYSKYSLQGQRFSVQDTGESAVRMGAIQRVYRSGTVIFWDDFRYGLSSHVMYQSQPPATVNLVCGRTMFAGYNARLSDTSLTGKNVVWGNSISGINTNRIGFEFAFANQSGENVSLFQFDIVKTIDGQVYKASLRINKTTSHLEVLQSGSVWKDVAYLGDDLSSINYPFIIKVILDFDKLKFVSVALNDVLYDLSSFSIPTGNFYVNSEIGYDFSFTGDSSGFSTIDILYINVTVDE